MDWREKLRKIIEERGLDAKAVSIKAGLDPSAVSSLFSRRPNPQLKTVVAIAHALEMSLSELVEDTVKDESEPRLVPVVAQVAAGIWVEDDSWDAPKYQPVPIVPTRYRRVEQIAYKVVGDSMDERGFVDGSYVITVPYWMVRSTIQDGDVVVVERREGSRIERTIKVVVVGPKEFRLEARSSNPKWADFAIIIPRSQNQIDDTTIEIMGLVIGSYKPVGG